MSYSTHGSMSRSTHGSKGASIIYVNFTSGGKLLMGYWKQQFLLVSSSNIVRCNAPPGHLPRGLSASAEDRYHQRQFRGQGGRVALTHFISKRRPSWARGSQARG